MMPGAEEHVEEEFQEAQIDYKQKYKTLKKKLRLLVYEQECFLDELRKAQRKLLKVSRDRSFLLDRLLQQEKMEDSSEESDATNSTDTEDGVHHREAGPAKKRKLASQAADVSNASQSSAKNTAATTGSESTTSKKKSKGSTKKGSKASNQKSAPVKQESPGHMTREELERHLDSKHNAFGIEKATASLPMEIFSNDPNHDSDGGADGGGEEEEDDLVIDVPH